MKKNWCGNHIVAEIAAKECVYLGGSHRMKIVARDPSGQGSLAHVLAPHMAGINPLNDKKREKKIKNKLQKSGFLQEPFELAALWESLADLQINTKKKK